MTSAGDLEGGTVTAHPRPPRRWRPSPSLVAWLAAFPGAWALVAAMGRLLPAERADLTIDGLGFDPLVLIAGSCCGAPLLGAVVLLYAILRLADARVRLWTTPLFVVCFVASLWWWDRGSGLGHARDGILATIVAAFLVVGEVAARRAWRELPTALCLVVVAGLELAVLYGLATVAAME